MTRIGWKNSLFRKILDGISSKNLFLHLSYTKSIYMGTSIYFKSVSYLYVKFNFSIPQWMSPIFAHISRNEDCKCSKYINYTYPNAVGTVSSPKQWQQLNENNAQYRNVQVKTINGNICSIYVRCSSTQYLFHRFHRISSSTYVLEDLLWKKNKITSPNTCIY